MLICYFRHKSDTSIPYVAIKILTADATNLIDAKCSPELAVNELISSDSAAAAAHTGRQHCLSILNSFRIKSVAGNHICLVLPLMDGWICY